MEPLQSEKSAESRREDPASSTRPPERKRRFQIVKLEERISPGGGNGNGSNYPCGDYYTKIFHKCRGGS
jgi:hypothetical protein